MADYQENTWRRVERNSSHSNQLGTNLNVSMKMHVSWEIRVQDVHMLTGLWSYLHYGDMVWWLLWLQCWNVVYRILWRTGRKSEKGVSPSYVNDCLEWMELLQKTNEEPTENLWVRIKRRARKKGIVGTWNRPPNQADWEDKTLCDWWEQSHVHNLYFLWRNFITTVSVEETTQQDVRSL